VAVACICLAVLIVAAVRTLSGRLPPLGRDELRRLERFSESRRREDSLPFG
jgi:hypothetical protein